MTEDPKKYAESIIEVVFNQRRPDRPPVLLKSDSDVIDTSGSGGRKKEMLSFNHVWLAQMLIHSAKSGW